MTGKLLSEYRPIFLFAACWRTGSTLVQRMLMSVEEVMIWGESGFLSQVSHLYRFTNKQLKQRQHEGEDSSKPLHIQWIPNISPSPDHLRHAFSTWFIQLYGKPALERGRPRWGIKEVRPGAVDNAKVLQEIFPEARFVFLVRNPADTLASAKGTLFYRQFDGPVGFLKTWVDNVRAFLDAEACAGLCSELVRYEDLIDREGNSDSTVARLFRFLDLEISPAVGEALATKLSGGRHPEILTEPEQEQVKTLTRDYSHLLGY